MVCCMAKRRWAWLCAGRGGDRRKEGGKRKSPHRLKANANICKWRAVGGEERKKEKVNRRRNSRERWNNKTIAKLITQKERERKKGGTGNDGSPNGAIAESFFELELGAQMLHHAMAEWKRNVCVVSRVTAPHERRFGRACVCTMHGTWLWLMCVSVWFRKVRLERAFSFICCDLMNWSLQPQAITSCRWNCSARCHWWMKMSPNSRRFGWEMLDTHRNLLNEQFFIRGILTLCAAKQDKSLLAKDASHRALIGLIWSIVDLVQQWYDTCKEAWMFANMRSDHHGQMGIGVWGYLVWGIMIIGIIRAYWRMSQEPWNFTFLTCRCCWWCTLW